MLVPKRVGELAVPGAREPRKELELLEREVTSQLLADAQGSVAKERFQRPLVACSACSTRPQWPSVAR